MTSQLTTTLMRQYQNYIRDAHPNYVVHFDEHDIRIWYVLIGGLPHPWERAEIIFQLNIPDTFPHMPPELRCLTPNGLFAENSGKICISIGEFHAREHDSSGGVGWRPCLGIHGFVVSGLINALLNFEEIQESGGFGICNELVETICQLSLDSRQANITKQPRLAQIFHNIMLEFPDRAAPYKQPATAPYDSDPTHVSGATTNMLTALEFQHVVEVALSDSLADFKKNIGSLLT
jgi:ubiquitin-protein ligase